MSQKPNAVVAKIDTGINNAARIFSYLGGIALLLMGVLAFANVIANKIFHTSITNTNELINYGLLLVVYCCVADCQLNGGGLMNVDIFFRMYPEWLKKAIKALGHVLGLVMYGLAGYMSIDLMLRHFRNKELASSAATSFQIWPFTLIYIIGTFFLAVALLWSLIRMLWLPKPDDQLGPYDYDLDEMNVHGRVDTPRPEDDPSPDSPAKEDEA